MKDSFVVAMMMVALSLGSVAGEVLVDALEDAGILNYDDQILYEVEERATLDTSTPLEVCTADGGRLRSWVCTLEEAESDQTLYRGGPDVTSTDGTQYCSSCRLGENPSGDSREAYLLASSGTPKIRCSCGYR